MATINRALSAPELCCIGALELAARIRAGEVSAREVVQTHLGRIEQLNPRPNALRSCSPMRLCVPPMTSTAAAPRATTTPR